MIIFRNEIYKYIFEALSIRRDHSDIHIGLFSEFEYIQVNLFLITLDYTSNFITSFRNIKTIFSKN